METETDLARATERMRVDDATLCVVRVARSHDLHAAPEIDFLSALLKTRAPIREISLHAFPAWTGLAILEALERTRAPIRVFRLCQFTEFLMSTPLFAGVAQRRQTLQKIVFQNMGITDACIYNLHALCSISDEAAAVLRAVGQHAARTLRPMLAPAVHCARSSECACEL
jgi:hypothetical protein